MKRLLLIALFFSLIQNVAKAQVGIGTTSPDSHSVLDLSSTSKGLLIPRLSTVQRRAISNPPKGLMVFDNDSASFFYYTGSAWQNLKSSASATNYWSKNSSSVTLADSTNRVGVGKTPAYQLDVRGPVNADSLMLGGKTVVSVKGSDNLFLGLYAGSTNTTGTDNYFSGNSAGRNNTTGSNNYFSGQGTGGNNTSGFENIFVGFGAGGSNTTGARNIFIGNTAGLNTNSGNFNQFIGYAAGLAILPPVVISLPVIWPGNLTLPGAAITSLAPGPAMPIPQASKTFLRATRQDTAIPPLVKPFCGLPGRAE